MTTLDPASSPETTKPHDSRLIAERMAGDYARWQQKNRYFHQEDLRYLRFLIPPGCRILDLGCGAGDQLAGLAPSHGVGVDFSPAMIRLARERHPHLEFREGDFEDPATIEPLAGEPFDFILLGDVIGEMSDVQETFERLHPLCSADTRIVLSYHSGWWEPLLRLAESLRLKKPSPLQNWLAPGDIAAILDLAGFEEIRREWRQLLPKHWLGVGPLLNRFIAPLPGIRRLCVRNFMVFRSRRQPAPGEMSVTVLIPCRNEKGNIEAAVQRIPPFAPELEILFVEGHSQDETLAEIHRVIAAYPERRIRVAVQDGKGKGDAVRKGFDLASGEVLMILDADLTVPPEALPKFYRLMVSGKAEFVNGTRLVYPMADQAMRWLNLMANQFFAMLFSYLLNQRFTDTLCGTKVLTRRHYQRIAANRSYFGDFDPFGDFDLIFGAVKQNLKVVELPIRYEARTYGTTQISRFRHGWLLLRMSLFAFRKLKAF